MGFKQHEVPLSNNISCMSFSKSLAESCCSDASLYIKIYFASNLPPGAIQLLRRFPTTQQLVSTQKIRSCLGDMDWLRPRNTIKTCVAQLEQSSLFLALVAVSVLYSISITVLFPVRTHCMQKGKSCRQEITTHKWQKSINRLQLN